MKTVASVYELLSFDASALPIHLLATVRLCGTQLEARFRLVGDCSTVLFADPSATPHRQDKLWEHTCFEVFINPADRAAYWELNFSPSGDWAAYRLAGYRTGLEDESQVSQVVTRCKRPVPETLEFIFLADLSGVPEIHQAKLLHCGITAVLQTRDGRKTYWALTHRGDKPDFHLKDSFTALLENHHAC